MSGRSILHVALAPTIQSETTEVRHCQSLLICTTGQSEPSDVKGL